MNICVFGGGGPAGRFGPDFCSRARSQGHTVHTISHRDHPNCITANFGNTQDVVDKFQSVAAMVPLDLVLYNTTAATD